MACSGQLGGKLGKSLQEDLGVKTPSDLLPYTESKLQELYGVNTGYVCLHCCFNLCYFKGCLHTTTILAIDSCGLHFLVPLMRDKAY